MKNVMNVLSGSAMILSAIIGAGLLGGKELIFYFDGGYFSIMLFAVFFITINFLLLNIATKSKTNDLPELIKLTFNKTSGIFYAIFSLAYFIVVAVMLAGSQQCMTELLNIDLKFPLFSMLTAICCAFVLQGGMEKIKKFNQLAIFPTIAFVICACILAKSPTVESQQFTPSTVLHSLQYVLYNGALSLGVICTIRQSNKKLNLLTALVSGILLCAIITMLKLLPITRYSQFAMPSLQAVRHISWLYGWGVASVFIAIMTSVLSNCFVLIDDLTKSTNDRLFAIILVMTSATFLSVAGIDALIQNCYPLIALLGIVTLLMSSIKIRQSLN